MERKHEESVKAYYDSKDANKGQREKDLSNKLHVKRQSATLQTNVYFDTVFGENIRAIESIINENEALLYKTQSAEVKDDASALMKFRKNIERGVHYYVAFAISNGFQSIDYQDPDTGNTFLHTAVKKGHDKVVEELLKYKANPDIKNKLGNYPVHEAWMFWNTDTHSRTKEERLHQEQRTCKILLHLFSYGAYVDATDLNKQTPLHIAARLGPIRAVKIVLSFRCDPDLATVHNQSAADIALEFHQEESFKLLQAWHGIQSYLVHTDFHTVWHRFLHDYDASMMVSKPGATILSELILEESARHMARVGRENVVFVDDPLLIRAMQASRQLDVSGKVPRPWESDWKKFVKYCKADGVVDLKTKLETLKGKIKGQKRSSNKRLGLSEADKSRSRLPDRPTPLTWEQRQILANGGTLETARSLSASRILPFGGSISEEEEKEEEEHFDDEESGISLSSMAYSQLEASQNTSVSHRRKAYAHSIGTDAKFLKFTKRLTQDSALGLSLRTPQAPMEGTEEGGSTMRLILSQGFEFERLEKYKKRDAFAEMLGTHKEPNKDLLGAYSEEVRFSKLNPRDILYDSLFLAAQAAAAEATTEEEKELLFPSGMTSAPTNPNVLKEPERKNKIDLVNDKRPRYVDKALLPAKAEASAVEKMIREAREKDEKYRLKKQNLSSESAKEMARQAMEAEIAGAQHRLGQVEQESKAAHALLAEENNVLLAASRHRHRAVSEKVQSMRRLFLAQKEVKYGQGRLTSSHNLTGKIEEPWTIVGGRYAPLPGDRTV
ncbi:ankyrin repeat domain-containing protein [archaeon]|nr:MAG: ankyrin repeat domain-containing protein [archaeon]